MSEKTNRLSICLIKSGYNKFAEIVKPGLQNRDIEGVGTFYFDDSHPRAPDWITDFFWSEICGGAQTHYLQC